jgi:putative transposase
MEYDPKQHHRRSIRLKDYDYTRAGAYFVTILARDRRNMFGEVVDSQVRINTNGNAVAETWQWLATQYPYVELDAWVVMPNHFHGVIIIGDGRGGSRTALTGTDAIFGKRKPLGRIIGAFKTVSTQRINALNGTPGAIVWQRNYYEHIIRDREDWGRVREYIATNPANWDQDEENPLCMPDERTKPLIG